MQDKHVTLAALICTVARKCAQLSFLSGTDSLLVLLQGLVKLADFGVAAKLGELEEQHNDELHQNVVGTPYWMAPEVCDQQLAQT